MEVASSPLFWDHHFFRGKKIFITSAVVKPAGPQRLASQNSGFVDQGQHVLWGFLGGSSQSRLQICRFKHVWILEKETDGMLQI